MPERIKAVLDEFKEVFEPITKLLAKLLIKLKIKFLLDVQPMYQPPSDY